MTTIAHHETPAVTGGVDTHKDVHVAAVLDELGRLLATESFSRPPARDTADCWAGCDPMVRSPPSASRAADPGAPAWLASSPPER